MHRVSRSGLEDFIKCPRCAYLKHAMDCWPPKSPPYTLNLAVDQLLKLEFDSCRQEGRHHPWTRELGLRPYNHPRLDEWRDEKRGLVRDCVESGVQLSGPSTIFGATTRAASTSWTTRRPNLGAPRR